MLSKPDALKALRAFFKKNRLAMLPDIYALLGTTSRMSAFRRLRELDYLSSFSHVGRYYTLPEVANFDRHGLWFYEAVGFSRFGNLKETVVHLVDQSVAGKPMKNWKSNCDFVFIIRCWTRFVPASSPEKRLKAFLSTSACNPR